MSWRGRLISGTGIVPYYLPMQPRIFAKLTINVSLCRYHWYSPCVLEPRDAWIFYIIFSRCRSRWAYNPPAVFAEASDTTGIFTIFYNQMMY